MINKLTTLQSLFVTFFRHLVEEGYVKHIDVKVKSMSVFLVPTNKKQLMRFYMRASIGSFVQFFSDIAEPLINLLS